MWKLKYCKVMKDWQKINNSYNWEQWCAFCKQWFEESKKFIRVDVPVTQMRWDDEVFCFHNECYEKWKTFLKSKYWNDLIF